MDVCDEFRLEIGGVCDEILTGNADYSISRWLHMRAEAAGRKLTGNWDLGKLKRMELDGITNNDFKEPNKQANKLQFLVLEG